MSDTREAGYEMDMEIATRVMGFVHETRYDRLLPPPSFHGRDARNPPPNFSTDIADAWTVIEKLNEGDWLVVVKQMPDGVDFTLDMDTEVRAVHRRAVVQLTDMRYAKGAGLLHSRHIPATFADTAPLAICLAALKAVSASGSGSE